jgi:type I restriction enzyme, S subunit
MMKKFVTISQIAEVNPKIPNEYNKDSKTPVTFLPMAAVSEQGKITALEESIYCDVVKGYRYFENGDIIVAKITPCMENGKAAYVENLPHNIGFGSTEFHVIRPSADIDGRYLFYMVWNPDFRFIATRNMTGTAGQKRVPTDFIKRYKIPLPPLEEQKRIAAILDKADRIRRKRQEAIRLTEELGRSIFLDMFGDPAINPKEWEIVSMKSIVEQTQYGTSEKSNTEQRGIPVLRMNNLTYKGDLDLHDIKWCEISEKDHEKYTVKKGDLLFNRTNSPELVGKTAVWNISDEYAFAGYLVRVRFNESKANSEYVSAYLNSSHGKKYLLR